jgi:hypothetical protein
VRRRVGVADVERRVFFYKVEMTDEDDEWKRADVLRAQKALEDDDRLDRRSEPDHSCRAGGKPALKRLNLPPETAGRAQRRQRLDGALRPQAGQRVQRR